MPNTINLKNIMITKNMLLHDVQVSLHFAITCMLISVINMFFDYSCVLSILYYLKKQELVSFITL